MQPQQILANDLAAERGRRLLVESSQRLAARGERRSTAQPIRFRLGLRFRLSSRRPRQAARATPVGTAGLA